MLSYNRRGNRRIRQNVRPVVWEDGGREAPSYPILLSLQLPVHDQLLDPSMTAKAY